MARLQLPWYFWPICIILQLSDHLSLNLLAVEEKMGCPHDRIARQGHGKPAIAREALGHMTGGLASPVSDAEGNEKCGPRRLTVRLAYVVNRGAHNDWLIVRT
ncbi:hypothetical protein ABVK25_002918 [Lepraria finkii]|uniref:Secreted protein n=1 Tax=Lepraria finkii TaxID=1340010 RepID=A0ABR4BIB0_9LECA